MITTSTYTPMGDDPRARWDSLTKEQNDLFSYTLDRNATLEAEIADLKDQIDLLQSGRKDMKAENTALKNEIKRFEEEKKVEVDLLREHQDQVIKSLEQQINDLKGYGSIAMCLIDGDGCVFSPQYLIKGQPGGEQAATQLKQELMKHLGGGATLCTFVYLNYIGLRNVLVNDGVCTAAQFNEFIMGFNRSTELFCTVNVGPGKEAADAKIREMLKLFAPVPQVKKIFFGGGHDAGYRTVLNSLRTDGLGDKVVMLDNGDSAKAIAELDLNLMSIPGLFLGKSMKTEPAVRPSEVKVSPPSFPSLNLSPVLPAAGPTTPPKWDANGQNTYSAKAAITGTTNATPRPVHFPTLNKPNESGDRPKIDRTKQMTRQDPTICNDYYLNKCYRSDCPFSHKYDLTEDDIEKLRKDLKTIACKGNRGCPGPEECWYRH